MEVYKAWVRRNQEFVHSLESLANGITWLLPERFSNSEIAPEAVYALLGITGAVNQHIIDTARSPTRPLGSRGSSFPWSLCVSSLKDLETLVEVAAQHFFGDDGKWNFIAVTEATKAVVRLGMLCDSGWKMLLEGGGTVNVGNNENHFGVPNGGIESNGRPGENYYGHIPPHLEKRAIAALSRFGESAKMAAEPIWRQRFRQSYESPAVVVEKPAFSAIWFEKGLSSQLFLTGEVLNIMRPLLYVLLIRKYGIRSWFPWMVSLAVDLTGMSFLSFATNPNRGCKESFYQLSSSEKDEVKRRKMKLVLYLMRDPFFTTYTKCRLEKGNSYTSQIPVIGFLTAKLVELIIGAQTRFTYTSGS